MSSKVKRPAFQFYPSDWLSDTALRMCSEGARGIWMDMICYMHEGVPYGHLKVNNKVILSATLARMVGCDTQSVDGYLSELVTAGVVQVDAEGCMFSKRMVKDEALRNARAAGGKLGGNPKLTEGKVNLDDNLITTNKDNLNLTPSSSSSSSVINTPIPPRGRKPAIEIQTFIDRCKAEGVKTLPPDDPVFEYAKEAGIPDNFLRLAWVEFKDKAQANNKRQSDWRKTFRNYIRGNYLKLWYLAEDNTHQLTTVGRQAEIRHGSKL